MPRARRKQIALSRAERNIQWCEEHLRVPEGKFVGKPLIVAPYMRDDFHTIFDNPAGTRRAIISRGRKNAKTVEAAMLMLLFLCGPEATPNGQLYSAAQSRDQAAVLFGLACKMIRMSAVLHAVVGIRETAKQLYVSDLGTTYRALSADASTSFGLSPTFLVHDELGQVRGPTSALYEALETATAAQENPLSIVISTQAPNPEDLLSILIDDALTGADPRTVISIQQAPMNVNDPFSDEAIRLANPAFDIFMNQKEVRAMAADAARMPSREPEYRNLVLNQRVEMFAPFISRSIWEACKQDPAPFEGLPVFGGLDLSSVADLTAKVYMAPVEKVWQVRPTFWLPGVGLKEKARVDRTPWDLWAKQGHLLTTPGKTVDYEFVAATLYSDCEKLDIRKIAFDRWNWKHLKPWLLKIGFLEVQLEGDFAIFEQMGQGFQSISPAMRDLENDILAGSIAHGNHPVLAYCMANAVVTKDPAGNRKLDKAKAVGRIDGAVALVMARGAAGTFLNPTVVDLDSMIG